MGEIYDVYGTSKKAKVMQETWGHLKPKTHKIFKGTILFAIGAYGGSHHFIIDTNFKALDSSPWFYGSLVAFVEKYERKKAGVFRFQGVCRMLKNERFIFKGKIDRLDLFY